MKNFLYICKMETEREISKRVKIVQKSIYIALNNYLFHQECEEVFTAIKHDIIKVLLAEYHEVDIEERKKIKLKVMVNKTFGIVAEPQNFFSALLIYGIYVPYFLLKYKESFCHPIIGEVLFDDEKKQIKFYTNE